MAAATGTKQQQRPHPAPPPGATVVDPKFEWTERAGSYVLRLTLTGFRKDDFRVQVDGAGRLTIRGTRPGASLHKVFQLPSAVSLDGIAGRFEAGVLTLTMPKRAGAPKEEGAPKVAPTEQVDGDVKTGDAGGEKKVPKPAPSGDAAPTSIEEIRTKPKEEQQKPKMEKELEPKASQAAAAAQTANSTSSDKAMAVVDRECLEETVRRRGEEERAKAAAAATAMEARAEQEKKAAASACSGWKERMTEGLGQLTDMKWTEGAMEMARKNKEVVAVGVAAFTLGFFVSQRFFKK